MTSIFLTGASGYIGGQVLADLLGTHPGLRITCLMRNKAKAERLHEAFGNISTVIGVLDDGELLRVQAEKSDIILHLAATGHINSTKALVEGLERRLGANEGYFVQIGGASVLAPNEIESKMCGQASQKRYNDLTGLERLRQLVRASPNRVVDNYLMFDSPTSVKSALIIGPLIYGRGRGIFNQRSVQAETIAALTLKHGAGVSIGEGLNKWSNVHITDISDLIVRLIASALGRGFEQATWGREGIYFAENGEMMFKELCTLTAESAFRQGFIDSSALKHVLTAEELDHATHRGQALLGTNARSEASRARELLGWNPSGPSLDEVVDEIVHTEALRLGK